MDPRHRLSTQSVTRSDKARRGVSGDEMLRASLTRLGSSSNALPPSYTSRDPWSGRDTGSSVSSSMTPSSESIRRGAKTESKNRTSGSVLRGSASHGSGNELLRASLLRMTDQMIEEEPSVSMADFRSDAKALDERLRTEMKRVKLAKPAHDLSGMFKQASSTDLLFLIDITHSMRPYIEAVKTQVLDILQAIEQIFFNDTIVRMAVVTYTDHNNEDHIRFLDFTTDVTEVRAWIHGLTTQWGADFPEDVLGGLDKAIQASWQQQNRCVIHIGDAPGHGSDLNNFTESGDNYHIPGSEPHGLRYQPLIERLVAMNINYAFLKVSEYTDRMALAFAQSYGPGNGELDISNRFCDNTSKLKKQPLQASQVPSAAHFREFPLGIDYATLKNFVLTSVRSSFTRTASRLSVTHADIERASLAKATRSTAAGASPWSPLREPSSSTPPERSRNVALYKGPVKWDEHDWFNQAAQAQGICAVVAMHNEETLQHMMASDDSIMLDHVMINLRYHSQPFAAGAVRYAYYARAKVSENYLVVKMFQQARHSSAEVLEDARIQALCKAFALEFNGLLKNDVQLDFAFSSCLCSSDTAGGESWLSLEPFINGDYVKYNNNFGTVGDSTSTMGVLAQAFSHFTFERSYGHLMVVDLQGSDNMLTDPAVHTKDTTRFGISETNLSEEGMKAFFATHECNDICRQLQLKSRGRMFMELSFEFRELWPVMSPVICCSNKFCRRIVRESTAQTSEEYPTHSWCAVCWPQLDKTKSSRQCKEPDTAPHYFEYSLFFCESQGQPVPSTCTTHREVDPASSTLAALGAKLLEGSLSSRTLTSRETISAKHW